VLPDGLQNPKRPAKALAHQAVGVGWSFGEGESAVLVFHAVAVAQEGHGQIRIFGDGVHVVATGFADCVHAPGTDRSWHDAHCAHGVKSPPLEILAGDVFERLPARPEIYAIANLGVSRDCADFRVQEVRHQS